MMQDTTPTATPDRPMTTGDAAKFIETHWGVPCSPSTVWRWMRVGVPVAGVKFRLDGFAAGKRMLTTPGQIREFFARLNAAQVAAAAGEPVTATAASS